ncbi:hypothetical protein [Acuticoccus mangrovi]|uniref:Uncharacterized protein n=1 Tax=Acuticoccus mangrovi TaxID=2796142 RepID=A0A934IST6_9HYPH|nr:hypothetical protein [Acuticoccus mangrovi]MBJ3777375.1 hypothetical protein [Acuticoccus mangrovi]
MRIAIVTPSAAFAESAGARIRYRRMIEAAAEGVTIELVPIDRIDRTADAYLFSKTYQMAAPAIAYGLAAAGKRVALDVFDDYFSERGDVRLQRFHRWFADMSRAVHRVAVSTPAMKARLDPRLVVPATVIDDPAPTLDPDGLAARLAEKAARLVPGQLNLLWFGIAANPYFAAGLGDLAAFAHALSGEASEADGGRHHLTILTNPHGASEATLAALAAAPVDVTWRSWSEAAEAAALAEADVAVLPVNAGAFSTAKSLNRAVTALAAGTQVLSLGAPLYRPLAPFLYRDLACLRLDAAAGVLRLRPGRVPRLADALARVASPRTAAARLVDLFSDIEPEPRPPHAVVLGDRLEQPALLGASGALTVSAADGLSADIRVGATITVADGVAERLAGSWQGSGAPLPPLSGHGVIDLVRMRARLATLEATARRLLPNHTLFVAHEEILAP